MSAGGKAESWKSSLQTLIVESVWCGQRMSVLYKTVNENFHSDYIKLSLGFKNCMGPKQMCKLAEASCMWYGRMTVDCSSGVCVAVV